MRPLAWTRFDRLARPLGLLGLAAVAAYNWRLWQRDKAFLAARPDPEPLPSLSEWPEHPLVSVLVAAWNEAPHIASHIESFLALRYPHKELVLCAGGEDGTYERAGRYAGPTVKVLRQVPGEGKQRALARALAESRGEVIFLTDADCLLTDEALERTIEPLVTRSEMAVTGRFAPLKQQRQASFVLQQWYVDTYWREHSPDYIEGLIGRNAAVTAETLNGIGGFGASVQTGTDYYLARQLVQEGIRIRFVRDSIIETEYKSAAPAYIRQQSRWLRNIILHGQTFGAISQMKGAIAQCLIGLTIIMWPVTLPLSGVCGLAVWLLALTHGTLARWRYIRFGEVALAQPRELRVYLAAPIYFLLDQFMLGYSAIELFIPKRRWRW